MKKCIRRFFSIFVATLLCCSILSLPATAYFENPPPPTFVSERWRQITAATGVAQDQQSFSFTSVLNGVNKQFVIEFPTFGGVRFYEKGNGGFFTPKELANITYTTTPGVVNMQACSGMTAAFTVSGSKWTFSAFDKKGKSVFSFSSTQLSYGYNDSGEQERIKLELELDPNDTLLGFGEKFNGYNEVGNSWVMWNTDHWAADAIEVNTESPVELLSYKNVPIFTSSRGYTLFYNSTYAAKFDLGKTQKTVLSMDFVGNIFDIYVWTGEPLENLTSYTTLTGKPMKMSKWTYRYSDGGAPSRWDGDQYINKITEVLSGYKRLGINNLAAVYVEGAGSEDTKVYNILKKTNTRLIRWYNGNQTDGDVMAVLPSLAKEDFPFPRDALNPSNFLRLTMDFTNPTSKDYIKAYFKKWIKMGLSGSMLDFGERVYSGGLFANGMTGSQMHNFYPYFYYKAYNEVWTELMGSADFVFWRRAACAGSQTYAANFGGDQMGDFAGLQESVYALLSITSSGFSSWGSDLAGLGNNDETDSQLYMRWLQFSTFSPLMRVHGWIDKSPWAFGEEATNAFVEHYWLRENLLDHIYSCSLKANETGVPMAYSMAFAYPDNEALWKNDKEYMFCDNLLVRPVVEKNASTVTVVFPNGNWYDLWSGSKVEGLGQTVQVDVPMSRCPVYIKAGSLMPVTLSAETLKLTDKIADDKSQQKALLVTPADFSREHTVYSEKGNKATYTVEKTKDNSTRITAKEKDTTRIISYYGQNVASVTVDGKRLERLNHVPTDLTVGYYIDGSNKTIICVPNKWSKIDVSGESTDCINTAFTVSDLSGKELQLLSDNDMSTYHLITGKNDSGIEIALAEEKSIGQVLLKWNSSESYCTDFTVKVSKDNNNWETVAVVNNGKGGYQYVGLEPIKAKYINISEFRCLGTESPKLAEINLFESPERVRTDLGKSGLNTGMKLIIVFTILIAILVAIATVIIVLVKKQRLNMSSKNKQDNGKSLN